MLFFKWVTHAVTVMIPHDSFCHDWHLHQLPTARKIEKNGKNKCLWVSKSCWLFTTNVNLFNQWEGIRMKMLTLMISRWKFWLWNGDSQETISFSSINTISASVCIFILVGYFLLRWSLKEIHMHLIGKKENMKILSLIEQKQSSKLK